MFMSKTLTVSAAVAMCALSAAAPARAQNGTLLENLNLFVGPEGSKQPQSDLFHGGCIQSDRPPLQLGGGVRRPHRALLR